MSDKPIRVVVIGDDSNPETKPVLEYLATECAGAIVSLVECTDVPNKMPPQAAFDLFTDPGLDQAIRGQKKRLIGAELVVIVAPYSPEVMFWAGWAEARGSVLFLYAHEPFVMAAIAVTGFTRDVSAIPPSVAKIKRMRDEHDALRGQVAEAEAEAKAALAEENSAEAEDAERRLNEPDEQPEPEEGPDEEGEDTPIPDEGFTGKQEEEATASEG